MVRQVVSAVTAPARTVLGHSAFSIINPQHWVLSRNTPGPTCVVQGEIPGVYDRQHVVIAQIIADRQGGVNVRLYSCQ
jgi:hypothetical protein